MSHERIKIMNLVTKARNTGARQSTACDAMGISAKTFQRWVRPDNQQDGRLDARHNVSNKLTELERQRVIKVVNKPEYAALSPSKIVPLLADKGEYIASESTFYRVLKSEKQLQHRLPSKPVRSVNKPRALKATAPNQLYSWDITYLPTRVLGLFFLSVSGH